MQVQPYLFFEGRAEAAIEFYRRTLGAEVRMLMRYKDSPEPQPKGAHTPPGDKVMHSSLRFFSSSFGMVTDRFGLMWMVVVPQART
jgi:PhnB protein